MKVHKQMFTSVDPNFISRAQASFERQGVMGLIGAKLTLVEPGVAEITLPFRGDLTQQHGFLHAGITTTMLDNACGFAAYSLMPADASVLSVEFKVNLLQPAKGTLFVARGEVVKYGRTITVCSGEMYTAEDEPKLIATMSATMMTVHGRPGMIPG